MMSFETLYSERKECQNSVTLQKIQQGFPLAYRGVWQGPCLGSGCVFTRKGLEKLLIKHEVDGDVSEC